MTTPARPGPDRLGAFRGLRGAAHRRPGNDDPFDHPDHYPYYALCHRYSVPMVMQAGTSGGRLPSRCGDPMGIDRPAIYFPDVSFVLSHTGWPWVDEAVAMALKFANLTVGQHWRIYLPYIAALLVGLVLIILFPQLSLFLPKSAGLIK